MKSPIEEIKIKAEVISRESFLFSIFGEKSKEILDGNREVLLFGYGAVGKQLMEVLQLHGVDPVCFCDNNKTNIGAEYRGHKVISFEELCRSFRDCIIVVATKKFFQEIKTQLLAGCFSEEQIMSLREIGNLELLPYYHYCKIFMKSELYSSPLTFINKYEKSITDAYNLMSDQKSKELFTERLALLTTELDYTHFSGYITKFSGIHETERATFPFYVSPEDYGYFNNDIVQLQNGEILVDAGAFNGFSTLTFIETCRRINLTPEKIMCFEPDEENFQVLKTNTKMYGKIENYQTGLWSFSGSVDFVSSGECDPGAFIAAGSENESVPGGGVEIFTSSLDEISHHSKITFIKMDIEGAELEALKGSASTIKKYKPKLAISAYHKDRDIFEIPLLINSINPDYKFYLRQYGYTLNDMILFAIP